jgi:hypothetical protein
MQIFDGASRGPWGAFVFLWRARGTALLATLGAIITILMLGFEPFTQQIIELHTQRTILSNTTGFVASTNFFTHSVSLVLASNVFWYLTIYCNRKSPYLYKNSVMAIMFHGLEGWEAYELVPAKKARRETYHDIMDTSTRMRASLRRNRDGVLELKKD